MTRSLYVLRHGKSDWDAGFGDDHARPLAPRGVAAARAAGRLLASFDQAPDLVLTSTAVRAATTAELAFADGGFECPISSSRELYLPSVATVLDHVGRVADDVERLLLVNHEPTCSALCEELTGARVEYPTAALARIDGGGYAGGSWRDFAGGGCVLRWLVTPKLLRAAEA